ncbi:hypothetical protein [Chryseobacterium gleum]|uniref:hypothetical protein n=1 Tax=Chryseobacterium gleum TaxID=250 RepID=UPI00241DA412|nr:hypothetical protein [Chryseobacterium gleum]
MDKLVIILFAIFQCFACSGQNTSNKEFIDIKNQYFKNAVNVENYLPKNADKKGGTDYTDFIQKALNENTKLIFPDFPILVSDKGLDVRSNQDILFQPNSKIILKSSNKPAYKLINIYNVSNVNIFYLNIVGDKYNHQSNEGEWGNGVSIKSSNNIQLFKPSVSKFWGDGIYIGQEQTVPKDITIKGGIIDDNRRNGISIISGINIYVKNTKITNTSGHNPQSGIDIEPNSKNNEITNVVLDSIITKNNAVHGIIISTGNLNGTNKPISIKINNHQDISSGIALGLSITRNKLNYLQPLKGKIEISNSNYNLPGKSFIRNYEGKKNDVNLILDNMNFNKSALSRSSNNNVNQFLSDYKNNKGSDIK